MSGIAKLFFIAWVFCCVNSASAIDTSSADNLQSVLAKCQALVRNGQFEPAFEACQRLSAALWAKSDFSVKQFTAVKRYALSYGDIEARESSSYRTQEPLIFYAEPEHYDFRTGGGRYSYMLAVDVEIHSADGKLLDARKGLVEKRQTYSEPMYALYFNLELTLTGTPKGEYDIVFTFRDGIAKKSTSVTKRVTID